MQFQADSKTIKDRTKKNSSNLNTMRCVLRDGTRPTRDFRSFKDVSFRYL